MATDDRNEPPSESKAPPEEADTSAIPPERAAPKPVIEDIVASFIDEKPTRPHLTVVPTPADPGGASAAKGTAVDDDPLAVVLGAGSRSDVEDATDAWGSPKPKESTDGLDIAKLLDIGMVSGGLRQLASWIEKQIPSINNAVTKFLSSVETAITQQPLTPVPADATPAAVTTAAASSEASTNASVAAAAQVDIDAAVASADRVAAATSRPSLSVVPPAADEPPTSDSEFESPPVPEFDAEIDALAGTEPADDDAGDSDADDIVTDDVDPSAATDNVNDANDDGDPRATD